jgi:DNA invertase Pin-like site-specific DNA recombinase
VDVVCGRAQVVLGTAPDAVHESDVSWTPTVGGGPPCRPAWVTRVSTGDQDLAGQVRRLEAAGAARTFQDVISGRTFERPGLTALLDYARAGDALVVVRLDRLGRSLRELLDIVERLKERGISLVSLEEKIDTSSAAGELVLHVFGSIAQFERRLIAERTRDGIAAARPEGRKPGRPALDRGKVRAALTLVRGGLSPTKAADQVGLGRSTVYRELARLTAAAPPPA